MIVKKVGKIPILGLGTWKLQGQECYETVKNALLLGYRHIDTADVYENHEVIGRAIKDVKIPREEIFITSKIYLPQTPSHQVIASATRFLKELNTPYIDLLLIHWPSDDETNIKALQEMVKVKDKGMVDDIGVSNFSSGQIERMAAYKFPIVNNQVEMHPLLPQAKLLDYCRQKEIVLTAYRPLGKGLLPSLTDFQEIGKNHNKTAAQVILRWIVQQNCPVIPKTSQLERLKENMDIFDFTLSEEEMARIALLNSHKRFCEAGDLEEEP